jgi:hypothetical protein
MKPSRSTGGSNAQQYDLAILVEADLDGFLVLVGGVVDAVIAVRFEEEMTGLPGQHCQPSDQAGPRRILEQQRIAEQEDDGADQMERLIDGALMIVPIVVEALRAQRVGEVAHANPRN